MTDLNQYPMRVSRSAAMEILCIRDERLFAKVVDANPQLVHRCPGETRHRYLRDELAKLLSPPPPVCDPRGRTKP